MAIEVSHRCHNFVDSLVESFIWVLFVLPHCASSWKEHFLRASSLCVLKNRAFSLSIVIGVKLIPILQQSNVASEYILLSRGWGLKTSEPLLKDWQVLFTAVPFKPLSHKMTEISIVFSLKIDYFQYIQLWFINLSGLKKQWKKVRVKKLMWIFKWNHESAFKYYLESPFKYYLENPFKYYLESARIVCLSNPFLQNRPWSLSIVSGLYLK